MGMDYIALPCMASVSDALARVRESMLMLTKGWDREQIKEIVREALEEIVEPIIFAEALESEQEFELIVQRIERLARSDLAADPDELEFMELDPLDNEDFEELVRDALDDLPDLLRNALRHVAVVISDGGRRRGAYGLYEGDGATRDSERSAAPWSDRSASPR